MTYIDKLKVGNSYHLKQVLVRSYQGDKFLQYLKQGATCEEIEDIGTVSLDDVNTYDTITNSEVAGVLSFDNFLVCLVCKSKVQPADEKLGTCTGCKTLQKISLCKSQVRAKLTLSDNLPFVIPLTLLSPQYQIIYVLPCINSYIEIIYSHVSISTS